MTTQSNSSRKPNTQSQLTDSSELAQALIRSAGAGIYIIQDGKFIYASALFEELSGYTLEELMGTYPLNHVHPEDREGVRKKAIESLKGGRPFPYEYRFKRSNGDIIWVLERVTSTEYREKRATVGSFMDITERKRLEEAAERLGRQNELILNSAGEGILGVDTSGKHIFISPSAAKMLGHEIGDLIGKPSHGIWHHTKADGSPYPKEECNIYAAYKDGIVHRTDNEVFWKKGGASFPVEYISTPIKEGGKLVGAVVIFSDITERKRLEETLKASEERLKLLFEFAPDAYYLSDNKGTFIDGNKAAEEMTGYKREELIGKNFLKLKILPAGQIPKAAKLLAKNLMGQHTGPDEFTLHRKDGKQIVVDINTFPVKIAGQNLVLGIAHDVTRRKRKAQQLTFVATHDPLTGLPNRVMFSDRLTMALAQAKRNEQKLAVMILDLDRFKNINDTLGHGAGDQLLKGVGDRLVGLLRKSDTVARLGGDEFMVLLPQIGRTDDATKTAQKILKGFQKPFSIDNNELSITTSIGIAIYPEGGEDVDTLIKNADTAMYRAKEQGRNSYQIWTTQLKLI